MITWDGNWNFNFKRNFNTLETSYFADFLLRIGNYPPVLDSLPDTRRWSLQNSGIFNVKSLYAKLVADFGIQDFPHNFVRENWHWLWSPLSPWLAPSLTPDHFVWSRPLPRMTVISSNRHTTSYELDLTHHHFNLQFSSKMHTSHHGFQAWLLTHNITLLLSGLGPIATPLHFDTHLNVWLCLTRNHLQTPSSCHITDRLIPFLFLFPWQRSESIINFRGGT